MLDAAKSYAARYARPLRIAARIEMCFRLDALYPTTAPPVSKTGP